MLHESWIEKKNLSTHITNRNIDEIYDLGIRKGAVGGKLLGAGGGGFLLFYVPHYRQKYFLKSFKKMTVIPFKFNNEGSEIMFNKANDKKF